MSRGRSREAPRPLKVYLEFAEGRFIRGFPPQGVWRPLSPRRGAEKSGPAGTFMPNQSWPLPENVTILSQRFFVEFNQSEVGRTARPSAAIIPENLGDSLMKPVGILLVVTLLLPFHLFALAQTPPAQDPQDDEVVRVESQEVKLDVVVKDKRGRPVKDLKPTDFEVYEDGVRQQIQSFRFVTRETAPGSGSGEERRDNKTAPPPAPSGPSTPGVIALVFDRLAPEARSLARKAGLAYAEGSMASGDFTGVFLIDQSLRTVQSFTDNAELVKQAINHATSATPSSYASNAAKVRTMADRSVALDRQGGEPLVGVVPPPPQHGAPAAPG